jgi:hypothetical protein
MIFNSADFFLLLAITVALYWQSASIFWRQNCLIAASLIFYAYWFPPYLLLFLALSGVAYIWGRIQALGEDLPIRKKGVVQKRPVKGHTCSIN